jgi:flagellum-specific ATP synthase
VRDAVADADHRQAADVLIRLEASYRSHEDLIAVGAYKAGADRTVDTAMILRPEILALLQQRPEEDSTFAGTRAAIIALAARAIALEKGAAPT